MSFRHAMEGLLSLGILEVSTCLVYFLPLCSPQLPPTVFSLIHPGIFCITLTLFLLYFLF